MLFWDTTIHCLYMYFVKNVWIIPSIVSLLILHTLRFSLVWFIYLCLVSLLLFLFNINLYLVKYTCSLYKKNKNIIRLGRKWIFLPPLKQCLCREFYKSSFKSCVFLFFCRILDTNQPEGILGLLWRNLVTSQTISTTVIFIGSSCLLLTHHQSIVGRSCSL